MSSTHGGLIQAVDICYIIHNHYHAMQTPNLQILIYRISVTYNKSEKAERLKTFCFHVLLYIMSL